MFDPKPGGFDEEEGGAADPKLGVAPKVGAAAAVEDAKVGVDPKEGTGAELIPKTGADEVA